MKPARVIHVSNSALLASSAALIAVAFMIGWFIGSLIAWHG